MICMDIVPTWVLLKGDGRPGGLLKISPASRVSLNLRSRSKSVALLLILSTTMEEKMRFKLIARFLLFAGLCVCLTSEELWLKNARASNTGRIVFTSMRDGNPEIYVMDADGGKPRKPDKPPSARRRTGLVS